MRKQTCNCHPYSPFHWAHLPGLSIFMEDQFFRAKGAKGMTASQIASVAVEDQRKVGKNVGSINKLGTQTKEKELAMIAYKQYGTYSRAHPNVKPTLNKHEL